MPQDIFIGVDGGGTKTHIIVENSSGKIIAEIHGDASNLRLSADKSWSVIIKLIEAGLKKADISLNNKNYNLHVGMGISGYEIEEERKKFLSQSHPFKTLILKQDSYTACIGAHEGKDGAIIIVGTGTAGIQIQNQKSIQVCGWGFPHDDQGSGAWLGLKVIGITFEWLDGRLEIDSPLLQKIFQKFSNNINQLVTYANSANSKQFAVFAPLVLEHIEKKDPVAVMLIEKAAKEINKIGATFVKRAANNAQLPCALFGGIAKFVEPWLDPQLKSRLVKPKHDAAKGAIITLKKHL